MSTWVLGVELYSFVQVTTRTILVPDLEQRRTEVIVSKEVFLSAGHRLSQRGCRFLPAAKLKQSNPEKEVSLWEIRRQPDHFPVLFQRTGLISRPCQREGQVEAQLGVITCVDEGPGVGFGRLPHLAGVALASLREESVPELRLRPRVLRRQSKRLTEGRFGRLELTRVQQRQSEVVAVSPDARLQNGQCPEASGGVSESLRSGETVSE